MKNKILLALFFLSLGLGLGYYLSPEKTKEIEKEVVKKDVITVVKEVFRPDGTKTKETIITDKSEFKKETSKEVINKKSSYKLGLMVGSEGFNFNQPVYGINIEKRFLGPVFLGAWGMTETEGNRIRGGLSISYEF